MRASCGHEIPFDDREDARHDSPDASRIGMFPVAQLKSGMAEDALQKKWIAWDLMLRRERGIDRVERGFVRGAEFGAGTQPPCVSASSGLSRSARGARSC